MFKKGSMMKFMLILFALLIPSGLVTAAPSRTVEIRKNHLVVDGKEQPQLFGAELQYFRLRGGQGPNIPREKVLELWNRALDRMVEAKMNAISFYIPWDFHEYQEGKFDFDGTVDEDKDGNADYPSRDIYTFFKLIEERGIKNIMARPGPYINAEWGFLGFGAIPLWFHEKYPDSHMRNSEGLRTKLYDYHNPDLLRHTKNWFKVLHSQVLKNYMGPGKPIQFLQLDNETNFMWQPIYNHDYGERATKRYRGFLKTRYGGLEELNKAHGTNHQNWKTVTGAVNATDNVAAAQDWYRFQDESIFSYLKITRKFWEEIGVREPNIIFTLAESYNAAPHGLLPNFKQRNAPNETGMMTMNMYPKTEETANHAIFNFPFKVDHDIKAMDAASDHYLGSRQEWLMGPEIQTGWWRGINVPEEARKQTYLSSFGHGLKALFLYYFTEGDNWQPHWAKEKIEPFYKVLKADSRYSSLTQENLPDSFWSELQQTVDRKLLVGFYARGIMTDKPSHVENLFFDAPIDGNGEPREHFQLVKDMGEKIVEPYGKLLAGAVEITDAVSLLKDSNSHAPSKFVDSLKMNADWSGGLLGYLLQAGVNPKIHHWGLNENKELFQSKIIIHQDNGSTNPQLARSLKRFVEDGGMVVNFLDNSLAKAIGARFAKEVLNSNDFPSLSSETHSFKTSEGPLFGYSIDENCEAVLYASSRVVGYSCDIGKGKFVQIGALIYDEFNSDKYTWMNDISERRGYIEKLLKLNKKFKGPKLKIVGADGVISFARKNTKENALWITVKSSRDENTNSRLFFSKKILKESVGERNSYIVKDLITGKSQRFDAARLLSQGINLPLDAYGSTAILVK